MIWVALMLIVAFLIGYVVWKSSDDTSASLDPDKAMQAAIELHRIRTRLDVAWARSEQRQGSAQLRREIAEALDTDEARRR